MSYSEYLFLSILFHFLLKRIKFWCGKEYVQLDSVLNDSITLLKGDETVDVNVLIDESAARPFEGEKLVNYIDVQLVAGVFEVGDEYSAKWMMVLSPIPGLK